MPLPITALSLKSSGLKLNIPSVSLRDVWSESPPADGMMPLRSWGSQSDVAMYIVVTCRPEITLSFPLTVAQLLSLSRHELYSNANLPSAVSPLQQIALLRAYRLMHVCIYHILHISASCKPEKYSPSLQARIQNPDSPRRLDPPMSERGNRWILSPAALYH